MPPSVQGMAQQAVCTLIRFEQPLALLGLYYLSTTLFHASLSFLSGIRHYVLAQWFPPNLRCYGRWAVVTLEDNTISYYYAEELARRGMDILLIGQEEDVADLKGFAERLQSKYSVIARVVTVQSTEDTLECIQNQLERLSSIGILVNQLPGRPQFSSHTLRTDCDITSPFQSLLQINHITKIVSRKMIDRKGGVIVNISDPSGEYPQAYLASYSAAAVYMDYFSRSLRRELSCYNVQVQSLVPYSSIHVSQDLGICTFGTVGPRVVARHAVNTIGMEKSRGYWWYAVKGFVSSCVPLCFRQYWRCMVNRPDGECQLAIE